MPFGAERRPDGSARFALWAPAATAVELELAHDHGRAAVAMPALGGGWFVLEVGQIAPHARYRYRIDDRVSVPDPASRCNPDDVNGASLLVDPCEFDWPDDDWAGLPWETAVLYELHVGTFTDEGTFDAAIGRLDYLAGLGVTAIELMPVAEFPGTRNWGYDGVLPYAPDASYGTPEGLKRLVSAAHARGLMVLLDVVYNHLGPEGNYLGMVAPQFFDPRRQTPWGAAINFTGEREVRDFFVHNALYWIEEYGFDGLRLDAVHAIEAGGTPHIVEEICRAVRAGPGRERHVHIVLENDRNQASLLARQDGAPQLASAQWNDDFHHAMHVMATGEHDGYYADYTSAPAAMLGRVLAEGFGFQGEVSVYRKGAARGEPSAHLPPAAFVNFLQSHDQVGNRALGERIAQLAEPAALRAGAACLLLAPAVPMIFMGEEFAASTPFHYFCDFGPELADAVRDGRRAEFARFDCFRDPAALAAIPDPGAVATFTASKLPWHELEAAGHEEWLALYRRLLDLRRTYLVPRLAGDAFVGAYRAGRDGRLQLDWTLGDGSLLHLRANLSSKAWRRPPAVPGELLYVTPDSSRSLLRPWGVLWTLEAAGE
jgi:maltooligosyltrehalose trehalohydrolase